MRRMGPDLRRQTTWILLAVGGLAFALLVLSFVVEIRIVVLSPNVGDVTNVLETIWRVVLGLATIGSFLLALKEASSRDAADGPGRTFEIKGKNHDIDVHLHGFDPADDTEDAEATDDARGKEGSEGDDTRETTPGRTASEQTTAGSCHNDDAGSERPDDEGTAQGES